MLSLVRRKGSTILTPSKLDGSLPEKKSRFVKQWMSRPTPCANMEMRRIMEVLMVHHISTKLSVLSHNSKECVMSLDLKQEY
jgi:hypothetical protein